MLGGNGMVKRKFEEISVETSRVKGNDPQQVSVEEGEDCTLGGEEVAAQDTPLIERFWQLLEAAGYEYW